MPSTMLVIILSHASFSSKAANSFMQLTLNKVKAKYFCTYHNHNQYTFPTLK